jgi:hypothetical protein
MTPGAPAWPSCRAEAMGGGEVQKFRDPGQIPARRASFLQTGSISGLSTRKARANQGLTRALPGNGRENNLRGKVCADARERPRSSWRQSRLAEDMDGFGEVRGSLGGFSRRQCRCRPVDAGSMAPTTALASPPGAARKAHPPAAGAGMRPIDRLRRSSVQVPPNTRSGRLLGRKSRWKVGSILG